MARSKSTMFTDTMVKKLKPEDAKYSKSQGDGFTIRVWPSGLKTWLYVYTFDTKRREKNLGCYPEVSLDTARGEFEDARRKVRSGIDPMAEKEEAAEERRKAPTVADLCAEYIEKWAKLRKKSWQQDQRTLDVEIVPKWGKRKAKDVRRRDVVLLLEGIAKRAPVMANRTRALLSKLFNFALEREIVEVNPCAGVKSSVKEKAVDRNLSEDEIKEVWKALSTPGALPMSDEISRCLRLILLTGQRPGEVVGMHSRDIDGQWWTIPDTKNGTTHRVFLNVTALALVGEKAGFIFESPRTRKVSESSPMHVNALAHAVRDSIVKPTEGIAPQDLQRKLLMKAWTPHDLRRTTATKLSELGFMDEIIDAVQNHKKRGMVGTYNRNRYDKEKQAALESWARKLAAITTGSEGAKVLPLRRKG